MLRGQNTIAPVATEDYGRASYEIWQAMAAGWDRERGWMQDVSRAVAEQMLGLCGLSPARRSSSWRPVPERPALPLPGRSGLTAA